MPDGSFLPEDDQDFLQLKGIKHALHEEDLPGGEKRRGIEFLEFPLPPNLYIRQESKLVAGATVSVLVLIPKGYAKTKLDSWYIYPAVFLEGGQTANCANGESDLFGRKWQFWSRHLTDGEWRADIDGLETYFHYIHGELRQP